MQIMWKNLENVKHVVSIKTVFKRSYKEGQLNYKKGGKKTSDKGIEDKQKAS